MSQGRHAKRLLAEAVVVVASILLAFAIDASWDRRQAREGETAVLEGIEADLQESVRVIAESRESTLRAYQALERFLGSSRSELVVLSPSAVLTEVFAPLTRQWGGAIPTGALDAATGSGELAVIRDPELRGALARLGSVHSALKEMTSIIGEMDARTVAILGEYEGVQSWLATSAEGLDPKTLGDLRGDPRVMGAASAKLWFLGGYLSQLGVLESLVQENLDLIAAALGR